MQKENNKARGLVESGDERRFRGRNMGGATGATMARRANNARVN